MRHIVSFSGGKDSTAMLLMMVEKKFHIDEIVCFDTGWEFPQMYNHWEQVQKYIGREITILRPEKPFEYWLYQHEVELKVTKERHGRYKGQTVYGWGWPSWKRRWCTAFKTNALSKGRRKDMHYIGIAVDEPKRIQIHELKQYPLVEWGITEQEALQYCYDRGFTFGGLYKHFNRVSCFCCPLQRVGELRKLRLHFPELWQKMLQWDQNVFDGWGQYKGGKTLSQWEQKFAEENQNRLFKID